MSPDSFDCIHSFLKSIARRFGERNALGGLKNGEYQSITYNELLKHSESLAKFLMSKGFIKGKKIVLLIENRIEFSSIAFGAMIARNTIVPLDVSLSESELKSIIDHCEPDLIFYSSNQEEALKKTVQLLDKEILSFNIDDFSWEKTPENLLIEIPKNKKEDLGILVYTSGTSGSPKGVQVKVSQLVFEIKELTPLFDTKKKEVLLSILPINHLYEFTVGLCLPLNCGYEICIAKSLDKEHLAACFQAKKVDQIIGVPLFLDQIRKGIESNILEKGIIVKFVMKILFGISTILYFRFFKRILFSFILKKFGGNLYRFVIGGAKTSIQTIKFFNKIGIEVYEGYGLSETGPVISTNTPKDYKIGSVGIPLRKLTVKIEKANIDGIGEIWVKGENVMPGYYKLDSETKSVLSDDGWFNTGDLGKIDEEGFLFITGRVKKMIVLSGGKKVFPEEVEALLLLDNDIQEAVVIGVESQTEAGALANVKIVAGIVPSIEFREEMNLNKHDINLKINEKVNKITKKLTPYKRPHEIKVFEEEFPKTTTRKIKLFEVEKIIKDSL